MGGYAWAKDANEKYEANGALTFGALDPPDTLTSAEVGNLEDEFYKAQQDGDGVAKNVRLTVRHSFRLWLDKVTGVEAEGLSQTEAVQRLDLSDATKCVREYCTINNGTRESRNCALCGTFFIEKYKLLRAQKVYFPNGTIENVALNVKQKNVVTLDYSAVGITNNERMIMCACYKGVGPYADSENGFQSVRELASFYSPISFIYAILVNSSLFAWTVASAVCIALLFTKNTAVVSTDYAADQRFYFSDQINALNKRNQTIQKKFNRLRMAVDS